jgi:putative membrane protein
MRPFQYMNGGGDGGDGILALIFLVLIIGAVIWVVMALVRERDYRHHGHDDKVVHNGPPVAKGSDAMRILDERFARGEIDADDYQHRRDLLRSNPE